MARGRGERNNLSFHDVYLPKFAETYIAWGFEQSGLVDGIPTHSTAVGSI